MANIEILKDNRQGYWSKSKAFLLPLTGISKTHKYDVETFLFWDNYSIENYNLIVKFTYDDYKQFIDYCTKVIFPIWDKRGYITESFDFGKETVFILDISEWALDIEMFLAGKYSKLSNEAKDAIQDYHITYEKGKPQIEIGIAAILDPFQEYDILDGMNTIEYISEQYGLPLTELQKIGEIGDIYDKVNETLSYVSVNMSE